MTIPRAMQESVPGVWAPPPPPKISLCSTGASLCFRTQCQCAPLLSTALCGPNRSVPFSTAISSSATLRTIGAHTGSPGVLPKSMAHSPLNGAPARRLPSPQFAGQAPLEQVYESLAPRNDETMAEAPPTKTAHRQRDTAGPKYRGRMCRIYFIRFFLLFIDLYYWGPGHVLETGGMGAWDLLSLNCPKRRGIMKNIPSPQKTGMTHENTHRPDGRSSLSQKDWPGRSTEAGAGSKRIEHSNQSRPGQHDQSGHHIAVWTIVALDSSDP